MEHRELAILLVLLLLMSAGEDTGKLPECVSFVLTSGNLLYVLIMEMII